ncbi:MAG: archaellin/type IV pilin N-terminal domain-containing protein [Candidatus Nanoarchaeia archaeon]
MLNKKGITPIIAIILLLMMTVAVAGAAFFWLSRIQSQLQGGIESYQGTMMTQVASKVDVIAANYKNESGQENLTIIFQNTGNTKISISNTSTYPTTTWILRDANQVTVCSRAWDGNFCLSGCGPSEFMDVGEMQQIILNLSNTACSISALPTGTVFSFTVDFSGKTTSSGSFIKS